MRMSLLALNYSHMFQCATGACHFLHPATGGLHNICTAEMCYFLREVTGLHFSVQWTCVRSD